MATMLDVGITVVPCLKACETLTNNQWIVYQISEVKKLVIDGETMGESLLRIQLFPRSASQLIAVGEESSDLVEMIQFAGRLLTEDCDAVIDQLASNMEPLIMMVMGVVVGFIVMGAMLPIVQLIQNL
jgi:type IV pilus assembly protein PilC